MKHFAMLGLLLVLAGCGQRAPDAVLPDSSSDQLLLFPVAGMDSLQSASFALEMLRRALLEGDSSRQGAEGMLKRLREVAARDTSLPSPLRDRWRTPMRVIVALDTVWVRSAGPDRNFGTSDDLELSYERPDVHSESY